MHLLISVLSLIFRDNVQVFRLAGKFGIFYRKKFSGFWSLVNKIETKHVSKMRKTCQKVRKTSKWLRNVFSHDVRLPKNDIAIFSMSYFCTKFQTLSQPGNAFPVPLGDKNSPLYRCLHIHHLSLKKFLFFGLSQPHFSPKQIDCKNWYVLANPYYIFCKNVTQKLGNHG